MCCNGTLDQKHKHLKRKHFQLNLGNVFSTWHLARSDIISHLMLKSQQPAAIPKIAKYPSKRSYHFQPNPFNKSMKWPLYQSEITHLTSLVFAQSKQLSYNSCLMIAVTAFPYSWDNFFMIVVTAFPDSWDNLLRTVVTAEPIAWVLLIFPHLAKTKTNYWTYLSRAKILSFSATFSPAALTRNSKNTLKLNIPFLAKS